MAAEPRNTGAWGALAGLRCLDQRPHPLVDEMPHGAFNHSGYGKELAAHGLHGHRLGREFDSPNPQGPLPFIRER